MNTPNFEQLIPASANSINDMDEVEVLPYDAEEWKVETRVN